MDKICRKSFKEDLNKLTSLKMKEAAGVQRSRGPQMITDEELSSLADNFLATKGDYLRFTQDLRDTDNWGFHVTDSSYRSPDRRRMQQIRDQGGSYFENITSWDGREVLGREYHVYIRLMKYFPYWADSNDTLAAFAETKQTPYMVSHEEAWTHSAGFSSDFWLLHFPRIRQAHAQVEEIVERYPCLYPKYRDLNGDPDAEKLRQEIDRRGVPKLGSVYIIDRGVRVIKEKVIFEIQMDKIGTGAKKIFDELSNRFSTVFFPKGYNLNCEVSIDRIDYYRKHIYKFLDAVVEDQQKNLRYLQLQTKTENYSIVSSEEKGATKVIIAPVYSREALERLITPTLSTPTFQQSKYTATYAWQHFTFEDLSEELSDLKKFLDNPRNIIKQDIPEQKDLWGVYWGKDLSDAQLQKVHNYLVTIRLDKLKDSNDISRAVDTVNGGSLSLLDPQKTVFINPFWFLKQSRSTQVGLLKRAFRALESNASVTPIISTVLTRCRKTIDRAISDGVVRHYEKLLKRKITESIAASKKEEVLFYIIKNMEGLYYTEPVHIEDSCFTDNIDLAEAFDNREDAEDIINELIYSKLEDSERDSDPENYLETLDILRDEFEIRGIKAETFREKKSALKKLREADQNFVIHDEKLNKYFNEEEDGFTGATAQEGTVYHSLKDARAAIKEFFTDRASLFNFDDEWVVEAINEVSIEPFKEAKIRESKEKDITVNFPIPVSDKGRIKALDARKLLKYLADNKLLKLDRTYFITDSEGCTTCWDLEEGTFNGYVFSCEVTETPEGEECDIYHELTFDKINGKLTNFEWECHRV